MVIAMMLLSCETEPLNNDELSTVDGSEIVAKKSSSSYDCMINLLPALPAVVDACTTAKGVDANNSYFDLTISSSGLAGDYAAWCLDQDATLEIECFEASVYSSYDVLPPGIFEKPENFDLVNWLYNQNFIGKPSSGGALFTFGDFQRAIWYLVDDSNCVQCLYLGDWDETRVIELVALAEANGEGYAPGAGDKLAVILVPGNNLQSLMIPYTLECEPEPKCETAFARDVDGANCFIDNGFSRWGWSIEMSGPGTKTYDIYAGAGQCDISKGEMVGTVTISYGVDGTVSFDYDIKDGYTVKETHEYAGKAMFPTKKGKSTVAPGQFYIEKNLSGPIYVIWHAEVCN